MHVSDFDYDLPAELIARVPANPRDASRMLVLDKTSETITDSAFRDLPNFLDPTDVLVLNDTRVIRARTRGRLDRGNGTSRELEVFFAEPLERNAWQVLCKPARRIRPGDRLVFGKGEFQGVFREAMGPDLHVLELDSVEMVLGRYGEMPLPPYLDRAPVPEDDSSYQTVFGSSPGAVAAPTAGLHFSEAVLDAIRAKGVEITTITLHVGIGTFLPIRTERPEQHNLRPERYRVSAETASILNKALDERRRVVAVGTTTTRTLEFLMKKFGSIREGNGTADLYILPGFQFRAVRGLLTNFHLPRSTLLMLVSAFAGKETILESYRHAIRSNYRFYSYGDCMLLT